MERRRFVAAAAMLGAWQIPSMAQSPGRIYRVAVFDFFPVSPEHPNAIAFFDELRRRGYVVGRNLIVERRDAGGDPQRLALVAQEVVAWKPDLITASSTGPNLAIKAATATVPILMTGIADPVRLGLVQSLARPGGNLTGIAVIVPGGFAGKQLQLLHEIVPGAKRVAVLVNPNNSLNSAMVSQEARPAAEGLGLDLRVFDVRAFADIEPAVEAAVRQRCDSAWVLGDPLLNPPRVGALIARAGLPLMSFIRGHTQSGGLVSYGPDLVDLYRRAGEMADRLLKGAVPAELPIEQPTKFELVINVKAAKTLGLTIPSSVLLRADELIE
ncbi:MAG TPA: ABC transporter substrate-binding protein [Caldimonas sp.]|nr:ABC transporter substrate-binding protein [Caldimonas sp.]